MVAPMPGEESSDTDDNGEATTAKEEEEIDSKDEEWLANLLGEPKKEVIDLISSDDDGTIAAALQTKVTSPRSPNVQRVKSTTSLPMPGPSALKRTRSDSSFS